MSDLPLLRFLRNCHGELAQDSSGSLADYIPELTKANPAHFGICIATVDGYVHEMGDSLVPFTIQSISKAFVFAMALETIGAKKVEATIGVEPSGDAFNSIRLNVANRPFNPMVNAGAIACSGLICDAEGDDAFERILHELSRFAGRRLDYDRAVFEIGAGNRRPQPCDRLPAAHARCLALRGRSGPRCLLPPMLRARDCP